MADFLAIAEAVKKGNRNLVNQLVQEALDSGERPSDVMNKGLIAGMMEIGEKFKNNEVYVPEVLIAARAMKAGLAIIKPLLVSDNFEPKGKVAVATVKGDLHDIGKNLVAMMLEGAGFQIIDLGVDCPPEKFVDAAVNQGAQIIAMSALLTTTMPSMKDTVDAFVAAGIRDKVKIIVGGAPVSQSFCDEIGADGYSSDAASAAELALKLIGA